MVGKFPIAISPPVGWRWLLQKFSSGVESGKCTDTPPPPPPPHRFMWEVVVFNLSTFAYILFITLRHQRHNSSVSKTRTRSFDICQEIGHWNLATMKTTLNEYEDYWLCCRGLDEVYCCGLDLSNWHIKCDFGAIKRKVLVMYSQGMYNHIRKYTMRQNCIDGEILSRLY